LAQSQVRFNRVPEKVPEKVWEALVQSRVRYIYRGFPIAAAMFDCHRWIDHPGGATSRHHPVHWTQMEAHWADAQVALGKSRRVDAVVIIKSYFFGS
jgi:hypothetical protein